MEIPAEPELVTQMREAGRNPFVQRSYLSLLPHQEYITRESMRIEALIGNIEEGIEYLVSLGINAAKLERELARLEQQYPIHFAESNRGYRGPLPRKPDFCSARQCMNS